VVTKQQLHKAKTSRKILSRTRYDTRRSVLNAWHAREYADNGGHGRKKRKTGGQKKKKEPKGRAVKRTTREDTIRFDGDDVEREVKTPMRLDEEE
jgi:hypothetical protein